MHGDGVGWISYFWRQDARKCIEQLPDRQLDRKYCTIVSQFCIIALDCALLTLQNVDALASTC